MTEASIHVRDGDTETREFRARRIARLRERHWTVLAIAVCVVLLALSLEVTDGQQVAINGWEGLPLPQLCSSQLFFGASCPGCGLTRSFVHLAHGRIAESIATHRVGWILALVVVLQVPYRVFAIRQSPVGGLDSRWPGWVSTALIVLLIGNWLAHLLKF